MASKWSVSPLDEVYDFSSGLSKPRSAFGSGFPFLSFKDVFYNSAVPPKLVELVESSEKERAKCSVQRGDVFLTRTSETMDELGMSAVALRDIPNATFNGFTKRLRPRCQKRVAPEFARYYFRSPAFRQQVYSMSSLSTRASLNNEMLAKLAVAYPSYKEQEAIGLALGALDDRIDLLRQTNATLEAIAQSLFKSWFVDFNPVRAKAEGRKPEGMDSATAALFPDEFEESELGLIPKGWQVDEIGKVVPCVGGATPSTKESRYWDKPVHHWVTPKDLSGLQSPVLIETDRKVSEEGLAKISSGLLPMGTLLLSSRAPIGYLAVTQIPTAINQGFIAMLPGGQLPASYLLFWTKVNMDAIKQKANGSTFMEISKSAFRPMKLVVPSAQVVDAFNSICNPLLDRIALNERSRRQLEEIRDSLLPRLISGKLRLPEAEKAGEEALA